MAKAKDLTGMKFGKWEVLERSENSKTGMSQWKCVCKCGTEKIVLGTNLTTGRSKQCRGCYIPTPRRGKYGESSFKALYKVYRAKAHKRGYDFSLTEDDFKGLTSGNCHYCGAEPSQITKRASCYGDYTYNGVDRVDNSVGYHKDNCVSCCGTCNMMKKALGYGEFLSHVERIHNHVNKG